MTFPWSKIMAVLGALSLGPLLSCQPAPQSLAALGFSKEALEAEFQYSSDKAKLDDIRAFYFAVFGRDQYTTQWTELEQFRSGSGISERRPYLDSWYPYAKGGTNVTGALARYDRAFYNAQPKAASWESRLHSDASVSWFGHCDGTSAASVRYLNPQRSVARPSGCNPASASCTVFSPSDIRALLSEINMNARSKFIAGSRCELTDEQLNQMPFPRSNPRTMGKCDDVNPASFHVGLINFLGRMKQPLIFDESYNNEVWNYPIYAYSYQASGPLSASQALNDAGLIGNTWIYNPEAASLYRVSMTIYYRAWRSDLTGAGTVPEQLNQKTYTYILELNKQRQVVGGEWTGASRKDHPDFLWMPFEPAPASGDDSPGNPHLNNGEVTRIWAESVGLDPESPFRDKPDNPYDVRFYPLSPDIDTWGMVTGYYRLVLDGKKAGAVFLGKKTYLRVEVAEPLRSQTQVEVLLNGRSVSKSLVTNGAVDVQFDSQPGINILSLRWTSQLVSSQEVNWDFRFYAM